MKALIWTAFGLIAALWTGLAALCAAVAGWIATSLSGASAEQAATAARDLPIGELLAPWVPPMLIAQAEALAGSTLDLLGPLLASSGWLLGWISPLVWITWGIGFVVLLAGTGILHWLVGARGRAA